MRYIFPFNTGITNIYLLICVTLSYFCIPIFAFICTHTVCGYIPTVTEYWQQASSTIALLVFGLYSLIGTICLYISYFRRIRKSKK